MHNFITIKTKKTEIGIGGVRGGWYLQTQIGKWRIERYWCVWDERVVWSRVDTEREAAERAADGSAGDLWGGTTVEALRTAPAAI
ncbi:hypothetical protein PZ895_17045 [Mesorhizobium sp. YIM 152430]|uniref:hypothetical protein n=1 Tax=Mesorhizobium sp. YIM 152430 TaxID=3031761 RepID=UPI0023DC74E9|nr:hypothetical protein [Mesorhizobium sp. YIM 152430]MDF1601467.1 hypothetical protein [Mesorhizobium sp. YIM 152430]